MNGVASGAAVVESPKTLDRAEHARQKVRHSSNNIELGRRGEEAAVRYLQHKGFEILERNWKCFAGEADIIARDDSDVVFVEVKTRRGTKYGFPSEAVGPEKRDRYEKIALAYLQDSDLCDVDVRFDIISIVVVGLDRAMVKHHVNAFSAT